MDASKWNRVYFHTMLDQDSTLVSYHCSHKTEKNLETNTNIDRQTQIDADVDSTPREHNQILSSASTFEPLAILFSVFGLEVGAGIATWD